MLTLPMKKKWFDMVKSGEKKEEYREFKEYYETRFSHVFGLDWTLKLNERYAKATGLEYAEQRKGRIRFRNGYGEDKPAFVAECTLRKGTGREEWGAKPGKQYYILDIHGIYDCDNCEHKFMLAADMEGCLCMDVEGKCKVLKRRDDDEAGSRKAGCAESF